MSTNPDNKIEEAGKIDWKKDLNGLRLQVSRNLHLTYQTIFSDRHITRIHEMLPEYMHGGLLRYILLGVQPGDFLEAILCNDYNRAVSHADDTNRRALAQYSIWLFNYAPIGCHGSKEKYQLWMARGGLINILHEQAKQELEQQQTQEG